MRSKAPSILQAWSLCLLLLLSLPASAESVLVNTQWLAKNLEQDNLLIVDMSGDVQYSRFHIPGAVSLDYSELVRTRRKDRVSFRLDDASLYKLLGQKGIRADHYIVIYDDFGGLNAGRLFWELERIGHKKVSVVDGGLVKWILEGRKVTNKPFVRKPAVYKPAGSGASNETNITEVMNISQTGKAVLLDVRSREEYLGYRGYPRTGHIPGARWWPWDENVDFEKAFTLKSAKTLSATLDRLGVSQGQEILMYCQSGHRASQAYLTLRSLGYKNLKLYDGSMAEYMKVPAAPVKQGSQP